MLGCFGVAPDRGQAISTATSGPYGGNMDYRGFGEGITAYFPVFVPGALFHLGDGHALQGDGEILGTGIEVSMDVRFTVRVLKGKGIAWPCGENDEFIFTVGNARPLEQALQHATTEMTRWLEQDIALDPTGAHLLLGPVRAVRDRKRVRSGLYRRLQAGQTAPIRSSRLQPRKLVVNLLALRHRRERICSTSSSRPCTS
jgi:acetamidase/formamidase